MKGEGSCTIVFDSSKDEVFALHEGYKTLHRRLKNNWNVYSNKEPISADVLGKADAFVLPGPRQKFTESEFNQLRQFVENGGRLLVLLGEGGEKRFQTNVNFLLEEFGISINNDAVVRTSYHKYFHPKETLISDGILNRTFSEAAQNATLGIMTYEEINNTKALTFLYPFGATLNVGRQAVALLSTGSAAFPLMRPICAMSCHQKSPGRILVLGSCHMFHDQYLDKEENNKDVIFHFLTANELNLNTVDAANPEISDYHMIPAIGLLADSPLSCLQESDELPTNHAELFDTKLFALDNSVLPEVIDAYQKLNMKHEPLRLITPQFETPLPPLQPAVFPPAFRELGRPKLELFDLDEAFSSEGQRLAQLANKCTDDADLEYFVCECGDVLGVTSEASARVARDARQILDYVLARLVEFRKLNQEHDVASEQFQQIAQE
ncbi:intraflagellar transport protein 52 homolog isoform X2 [Ornithodoros turicata]|uniref:intraflagellar transport protein 52 homolog isoform X2 n=1 Tax=Ornithodoros turicata TaxID=34597 RepID=UPI003138E224